LILCHKTESTGGFATMAPKRQHAAKKGGARSLQERVREAKRKQNEYTNSKRQDTSSDEEHENEEGEDDNKDDEDKDDDNEEDDNEEDENEQEEDYQHLATANRSLQQQQKKRQTTSNQKYISSSTLAVSKVTEERNKRSNPLLSIHCGNAQTEHSDSEESERETINTSELTSSGRSGGSSANIDSWKKYKATPVSNLNIQGIMSQQTTNTTSQASFLQSEQRNGNVISNKQTTKEVMEIVRRKVFSQLKFTNDQRMFDYQPIVDVNDPNSGLMYRYMRSECNMIGQDDRAWWKSVELDLKKALCKRRSTTTMGIKEAFVGK
jgi:hypothetical protein